MAGETTIGRTVNRLACPDNASPLAAAAVFLAAFAVFGLTAFPGMPGGDGGELVAAVVTLGIPHPTGYPLFLLLGRAWLWLFPFGNEAFRLNLFSALTAAAAAAALYRLHRELGREPLSAAALALLFAFGPTFWSQAVMVEVYPLHMLLLVLFLLQVRRWVEEGSGQARCLAALLGGVMLTNHLTAVFLLAAGAPLVLFGRPGTPWRRGAGRLLALALLPLALYAVLVLRSLGDPPVDTGNPETARALLKHVSGGGYGGKLLPVLWGEVPVSARYLGRTLAENAPFPLWAAGGLGLLFLVRRRGRFGLAVAALAAVQCVFCLFYRVQDLAVFSLPVLLALNLGLSALADAAAGWLERVRPAAARLPAALLAGAAVFLLGAGYAGQDQSRNHLQAGFGADLLDSLPFGAQVAAWGDVKTYALLYSQVVEQRRTDVSVDGGSQGIFQGYGGPARRGERLFLTDVPFDNFLPPGAVIRPWGMLRVVDPAGPPAGNPWEAYRPVPDMAEMRRLAARDITAHHVLLNREVALWLRAGEAGDEAEARRLLAATYDDILEMNSRILPQRNEIYFAFQQAVALERWSEAVPWGERLVARGEADAQTLNNLAWSIDQGGGSPSEAERYARAAVARMDNPLFLDTLTAILWHKGERDEARAVLADARRRFPDDETLRRRADELGGGRR